MNKKFSTLVASLLLASSIGTVNAADAPVFVKYKDAGSVATSVKQGTAFQLSTGEDGKVLALVRTGNKYNYKYELKVVAKDAGTNLAETLWKITYQENQEGGPSFTFVSAAYGIPLSFTPQNVDADDVIAQYPGTDGLWKWLPSLNVTGSNKFEPTALINNYSAKLDSAVVLATSGGKVVAQRYKTSGGVPSNALKLEPVIAEKVILGADDLNSMMMTQDVNKFKLTFNDDVKGSAIGNLWTKGMLKAEPAVYKSPIVYSVEGAADATYYSADEAIAAAAGYAAAKHVNTAEYAQELIETLEVDTKADAFVQEVVDATIGVDFAEAAEAAKNATKAKIDEIALAEDNATAAAAVKTAITGEYGNAVSAENNNKTDVEAVIVDDNLTSAESATKTALVDAFKAEGVLGTNSTYDAVSSVTTLKNNVETLVGKLAAQTIADNVATLFTNEDAAKNYIATLYDASVADIVKSVVTASNKSDATALNEALAAVQADAGTLATAINGAIEAMVLPKEAMTKNEYILSLENSEFLATIIGDGVKPANVQTVAAAVKAAIEGNQLATDLDACKTIAETTCDSYEPVANATEISLAITSIDEALDAVAPAAVKTAAEAAAKDAADSKTVGDEIAAVLGAAYDAAVEANVDLTLADAIAAIIATDIEEGGVKVSGDGGEEVEDVTKLADYVMLSLDKKKKVNGVDKDLYLAVDTNFVTSASGRRHLTFAEWYYAMPNKSNGTAMPVAMQRDYNGHFNFKFTYFPTQDSLVIETDGYAMLPAEGTKYWVDINNPKPTYSYEGNGKTVMLAVLADNHTEATVGMPQEVAGTNRTTLNTRIGFNANVVAGAEIAEGVYTIQYISNDADKKDYNGRYVTANWLINGYQAMAKVEDQNLTHIPAAQWMISHNNGSNINTIVNRESGEVLNYYGYSANTGYLPVQYLYSTETANLYTTVYGDSLKLSKITDNVALADSTLGYYAAAKYNEETADQLEVYALRYLNEVENLFVNYTEKDSILNVTKSEEAEVYFRLIPAFDAVQYGASDEDLAKDLYRQAYYIQLETPNKNVKDEDKLYVAVNEDGKYRLVNRQYEEVDDKNVLTWNAAQPFLLKEFKEVDGTCNYALIEAKAVLNDKQDATIGYILDRKKVSVKDYPSILVRENLEGENLTYADYGFNADGRTSTFALVQKDAPKYRRLNVTDAEDGLKDMDVNNAEFFVTRHPSRFLYENTANKVAGYEADPLGLNFLGDFNVKEIEKNGAMFVDTAYVRYNTNRPQYMLALRPDFTPVLEDCPYDPSHGKHEIPQVKASYLVTLSDSVANAINKVEEAKFTYENRKYTRLAFVDAIHRGDSLIIQNSKFTGTENAAKDTIDLSKNAFVEGAWQFRLTGNADAEFYIEGAANNSFIRLINGVAVLTDDIADAERFNIVKTDKTPTANDAINASEVSVIATNGAIIVKGAAGKNVIISNVLGQTIANTVLSSDEATIAAPKGYVTVAVEGEKAVKAIVK